MIAGPRFSPVAYRNTALEELLPVFISRVPEGRPASIKDGFRPELTKDGADSSIFRFFEDKTKNENFIKNEIQPIFWYCQGVQVKPGVGEVYAQHPSATAPDGRKAPLLVLRRYGAGVPSFPPSTIPGGGASTPAKTSSTPTGSSSSATWPVPKSSASASSPSSPSAPPMIWATRFVCRSRFSTRNCLRNFPSMIPVEIKTPTEKPLYRENMVKQEGQIDLYLASYTADKIGKFQAKLPPIAGGVDAMEVPFEVNVPGWSSTSHRSTANS